MGLEFWKVESVGNDFPLFREEDAPEELNAFAAIVADRHFGIGGDGLLTVRKEEGDLRLRMFNPDGTEDFCGNGIRAAVRWARDVDGWPEAFTVRHLDRRIPVRTDGDQITSEIGPASYRPEDVPTVATGELFDAEVWSGFDAGEPLVFFGSALTTGSTHVVIPTGELPDDEGFASVSAQIENDPRYPARTSVIWRKQEGESQLRVRIWERGVGETLGCGTGASAAAADLFRRRSRGGKVTVCSRGGEVTVHADRWDALLTVTGTARVVYEGEWLGPTQRPGRDTAYNVVGAPTDGGHPGT